MRSVAIVAGLLLATSPKLQDFPLTVHVTSSVMVPHELYSENKIMVVLNGAKLEMTEHFAVGVLKIGDYPARLVVDHSRDAKHATPAYEDSRIFELQMPDGKTEEFAVTGEFE